MLSKGKPAKYTVVVDDGNARYESTTSRLLKMGEIAWSFAGSCSELEPKHCSYHVTDEQGRIVGEGEFVLSPDGKRLVPKHAMNNAAIPRWPNWISAWRCSESKNH